MPEESIEEEIQFTDFREIIEDKGESKPNTKPFYRLLLDSEQKIIVENELVLTHKDKIEKVAELNKALIKLRLIPDKTESQKIDIKNKTKENNKLEKKIIVAKEMVLSGDGFSCSRKFANALVRKCRKLGIVKYKLI